MAWHTPHTWVGGELVKVTGDDVTTFGLNDQLSDQHNFLKTSLNDSGKLKQLTAANVASCTGVNLTGVAHNDGASTYTAGEHNFNSGQARVIAPVGTDKWGT